MIRKTLYITCLLFICLCGCQRQSQESKEAERLLDTAYRLRYCDADSTEVLTNRVLQLANGDDETKARAYNSLAFTRYHKMDYDGALLLCDTVYLLSHNQVVLLCADVMRMKVTQRIGDGGRFYQARSSAQRRLKRIAEEADQLSSLDKRGYIYGETEFHIISSTYHYYQEQDSLSRAELASIQTLIDEHTDTTQWVNYLYMMGSGGMVDGTYEEVATQEFDYLINCFAMSLRTNMHYFTGNALQALATRLKTPYDRQLIRERFFDAYNMLFGQHLMWMDGNFFLGDSLFTTALARHALQEFEQYDDLFQTACAHRTVGEINFYNHNYEAALDEFQQSLDCVSQHHNTFYPSQKGRLMIYDEHDTAYVSTERRWIEDAGVSTVPEWMAGIRQQLSLTYSAMGLKMPSDYNRNIYLDILECTTQNREMESRMDELQGEMDIQHKLVMTAGIFLTFLIILFVVLVLRLRPHQSFTLGATNGTSAFNERILKSDKERIEKLMERLEEAKEANEVSRMRTVQNKVRNTEKRAKVSLVQAVTPFLDRILNEVSRIKRRGNYDDAQLQYISELTDQIVVYNDILTEWIQMERGQLALQISTVDLSPLFNLLERGHYGFDQKGVHLVIEPTDCKVKADEALTLFMLNTLADNARKFTPQGGTVTLSARAEENYVELSVRDTGCGLKAEDIDTIVNSKVYDAAQIGREAEGKKGFGYGLMNCKGIIEKYKKTSSLFSVCTFGIESKVGQGSRFFFRLPRVLILLAFFFVGLRLPAGATNYYDKVYECNLEGRYEEALLYADSALYVFNPHLMLFDELSEEGVLPCELDAFRHGEDWDYLYLIQLRNEIAVAALALNDWELYRFNNHICISLHKLYNQDASLPSFFDTLQKAKSVSQQIMVLLVLLSLLAMIFIYLLFRGRRKKAERIVHSLQEDIDEQDDMLSHSKFLESRLHVQNQVLDNCLSTIKHESMYYPSRIRQLVSTEPVDIVQLDELTTFYKQIYTLLAGQAERQIASTIQHRDHIVFAEVLDEVERTFRKMARQSASTLHIAPMDSDHSLASSESALASSVPAPCAIHVRADGALLAELFNQLFRYLLGAFPSVSVFQLSYGLTDGLLCVVIRGDGMHYSEQEAHNLFFPDSQRIPLLIVKQIVRDTDAMNHNPGLRLVAEEDSIWFTLPVEPSQEDANQ